MAVIDGGFANRRSGPVDSGGEPPDDSAMEARVAKLEAEITAIKIDVAVIKANGATKSDIADVKGAITELRASSKTDIAEAKSAIIIWVASIVFLAQLVPAAVRLVEKYF